VLKAVAAFAHKNSDIIGEIVNTHDFKYNLKTSANKILCTNIIPNKVV